MHSSIEGYMLKAGETQSNTYQLRFFRILFSSGKFIIKIDKQDKKMKSYNLNTLVSAVESKPHRVEQARDTLDEN